MAQESRPRFTIYPGPKVVTITISVSTVIVECLLPSPSFRVPNKPVTSSVVWKLETLPVAAVQPLHGGPLWGVLEVGVGQPARPAGHHLVTLGTKVYLRSSLRLNLTSEVTQWPLTWSSTSWKDLILTVGGCEGVFQKIRWSDTELLMTMTIDLVDQLTSRSWLSLKLWLVEFVISRRIPGGTKEFITWNEIKKQIFYRLVLVHCWV